MGEWIEIAALAALAVCLASAAAVMLALRAADGAERPREEGEP